MLKSKDLILYLFICVLSLGVIGSGMVSGTKQNALKSYVSANMNLKEQNRHLEGKLGEIEETYSQLEDKNRQPETEIKNLRELQLLETKPTKPEKEEEIIGKLKNDLEQKQREHNTLKEEYNLLQEAYSELLKEKLIDLGRREEGRRGRLTPEQMENFMMSRREDL